MIQIKDINLGFTIANGIEWTIYEYKTGQPVYAVVLLFNDNAPINNWDGGKIGIKVGITHEVLNDWGADDSVIDNFILSSIGAVKL